MTSCVLIILLYGAKLSRSTIFSDFTDGSSTAKIALRGTWLKWLIIRIFIGSTPFGAVVWLCLQWCIQTMSLFCYFSPVSADQKLPDPQGAIARDHPSSSISAANAEVKRMQSEQQIPQNRRVSRTQSSRTYKGWDSTVNSSRAGDSFNHPLFCQEVSRSKG